MTEYTKRTVIKRKIACRFCNSTDLVKNGFQSGNQRYRCKNCRHTFVESDCYPRMRYPKNTIIRALTYYYNGMSYKGIVSTFDDMANVTIPRSTVFRWIIKYSKMVNRYALTLKPKLSDVWIADETAIFIKGKQYWFWDIIDEGTRFLIASHLSRTRTISDATKLFYMAKLRSQTKPKLVLTDKLRAYHKAFNKVFYSRYAHERIEHLTSRGFGSPTNINLIERFHGTLKQRTKIMRDLQGVETARIVLDGFLTHYNFFLEHSYLNDLTPAQMGGITEDIHDWGDLIELAYRTPVRNIGDFVDWDKEFGVKK